MEPTSATGPKKLSSAAFRPRQLFERFNIEVLCTTDAAIDPPVSRTTGSLSAGAIVCPY
jgi:hypothetical protein